MNKALVGVGVAVALLAAVFLMRDGVSYHAPGPDPAATWNPAERRHAPEVVLAISPKATPPKLPHAAPAEKPRLSAAMQEFISRQPLKPLFDRLSASSARTPEEDYLLARILDSCARVAGREQRAFDRDKARAQFVASVAQNDPRRDKRIAAWDEFNKSRCDGIEAEATPEQIRALLEKAAAGGDPKARARLVERDVWAPFDKADGGLRTGAQRYPSMSEAQAEALRQAAQSGDPLALLIAGKLFASTMGDLVIRAGPEGQPIDPRPFHDAWTLLACEQGLACGPEHRDLLEACATRADCDAADLRQHLFYYQHSPQQSQRLYEYYGQLQRATRSGDWSWFTFHRGAPPPGSTYFFR